MFKIFGFKLEREKEDITGNINHAQKILKKYHKDRILAWIFLKIKDYLKSFVQK